AVVTLLVLTGPRRLPVGEFEAPLRIGCVLAVIDETGAVTAGQVPGDARPGPVNGVGGLRVPDRRAAVVPDPVALVLLGAGDRQVRLRGAEGRAVEHRFRQPLRRLDPACQPLELIDQVIVQEQLRSGADGQRPRRLVRMANHAATEHHAGNGSAADFQEFTTFHEWTFSGWFVDFNGPESPSPSLRRNPRRWGD